MKEVLKKILKQAGYEIHNTRKTYLPNDDAYSVKQAMLKKVQGAVIFDVGAYYGNVSLKYNHLLPGNRIFAFEPSRTSYNIMKGKTSAFPNILTFNIALGNNNGKTKFHQNEFDATSSLLSSLDEGMEVGTEHPYRTIETFEVEVVTVDTFCSENNIGRIDLLKLDTQGSEYQVLEGAENMIRKKNIGIIYTEILVAPVYDGQIAMYDFLKRMSDYGYRLFNFYNYEFHEGRLCQMDAIFTL